MGVGAFFGCRPEQFDTNPTGLYGVELDHISARIAGQLYQSAHIYACRGSIRLYAGRQHVSTAFP